MTQFDDDEQPPVKMPKVTGVAIHETIDSLDIWFKKAERMKYVSGLTCVVAKPFTGSIKSLRTLVPEHVSGCTTSCLYQKEARGYYCYFGSKESPCSPEYSIMTVSETTCRSDHTCGTIARYDDRQDIMGLLQSPFTDRQRKGREVLLSRPQLWLVW